MTIFFYFQLSQARTNATEAYRKAELACQAANAYLNRSKALISEGNDLIANLTVILNNNTASPGEIRKLAEEVSLAYNEKTRI